MEGGSPEDFGALPPWRPSAGGRSVDDQSKHLAAATLDCRAAGHAHGRERLRTGQSVRESTITRITQGRASAEKGNEWERLDIGSLTPPPTPPPRPGSLPIAAGRSPFVRRTRQAEPAVPRRSWIPFPL